MQYVIMVFICGTKNMSSPATPASPLSIFDDFKSKIYSLDIFLRNVLVSGEHQSTPRWCTAVLDAFYSKSLGPRQCFGALVIFFFEILKAPSTAVHHLVVLWCFFYN
jgi:hypothetical protein